MMYFYRKLAAATAVLVLLSPVIADANFTGPSVGGQQMNVAAASSARVGTYVTLTGRITSHLREQYYRFADDSGEMRIEIPGNLWAGRQIGPEHTVSVMGEVDRTLAGTRYLWVKSLTVVE